MLGHAEVMALCDVVSRLPPPLGMSVAYALACALPERGPVRADMLAALARELGMAVAREADRIPDVDGSQEHAVRVSGLARALAAVGEELVSVVRECPDAAA